MPKTVSEEVRDRDKLQVGESVVGVDEFDQRGVSIGADGIGICVIEPVGESVLGVYASGAAGRAVSSGGDISTAAVHQISGSGVGANLWMYYSHHCSSSAIALKFGSTETRILI